MKNTKDKIAKIITDEAAENEMAEIIIDEIAGIKKDGMSKSSWLRLCVTIAAAILIIVISKIITGLL